MKMVRYFSSNTIVILKNKEERQIQGSKVNILIIIIVFRSFTPYPLEIIQKILGFNINMFCYNTSLQYFYNNLFIIQHIYNGNLLIIIYTNCIKDKIRVLNSKK
ncbi:hypothetical protein H311_02290 [Anncaliia algerae PRA109]|nr:hypothetical protein H311_02290 [Anncaliia algerae PRA109]